MTEPKELREKIIAVVFDFATRTQAGEFISSVIITDSILSLLLSEIEKEPVQYTYYEGREGTKYADVPVNQYRQRILSLLTTVQTPEEEEK